MKCLKNFAKRLQSDNGGKGCNYFWLILPKDSAEITVTHTLVARDIFGFTGTRMDAFIAALGGKSNAIKKIEKVFNETTGCVKHKWNNNQWFRIKKNNLDERKAEFKWPECIATYTFDFRLPPHEPVAAAAIQRPDPPAVAPAAPAVPPAAGPPSEIPQSPPKRPRLAPELGLWTPLKVDEDKDHIYVDENGKTYVTRYFVDTLQTRTQASINDRNRETVRSLNKLQQRRQTAVTDKVKSLIAAFAATNPHISSEKIQMALAIGRYSLLTELDSLEVDFDGVHAFSKTVVVELDFADDIKLLVYPSNAEKEINIRFTSFETPKSVLKIVNSVGELMYEEIVASSTMLENRKIDLTGYESGLYYVSLTDGAQFLTTKFVVTKLY